MIIEKYTAYFHDGSLIDIQHNNDQIVLSLGSAEMDFDEVEDSIQLSERNTIMGKLYLEGIISINLNENKFFGVLKMKYDSGKIFDLEIKENKVEISLSWENFPLKPDVNDFDSIEIKATKIRWENIPGLFDPFW
jgi:hypothetical protein